MAPPEQRSRGGFSSSVFPLFCRIGKWSPTPPYHLQDDEEVPGEKNHPVDAEPFGVDYNREVLAHDIATHNEPDALSNQKLPWDPAEIRVLKTRISA